MSRESLFLAQHLLDLYLRRNTRMVGAGDPHSIVALHALGTDKDILERVVQRMTHMELTGNIRRRDYDIEGLGGAILARLKITVLLPKGVPFVLKRGR